MTGLRLYNSLGRELQAFEPLEEGKVGLYTCGPTVYAAPHIGNLRTFLFEDVLRRTLELLGYEVLHVMNLTDVEDKIIRAAGEAGVAIDTFTAPHIETFHRDMARLAALPAHHYPRATEHVDGMIEMVERLLARDHAYEADGSVFFRIRSFEDYGRLSGVDASRMRRGERVADDEYEKDDVRDFVLWKAAKEGEPSWPSPWGPGRPGWHIECSAMSRALLGSTFDIHCGGVDNKFPHHENEIAQSEGASGEPFVRYWLHSEHLLVDGEKMAKSLGNQYVLDDLVERGLPLRSIRYHLISVHYRQKVNFTFEGVDQATRALGRVDSMLRRLDETEPSDGAADPELARALVALEERFRERLADDLNVAGALSCVFDAVREANRAIDAGVAAADARAIRGFVGTADEVFAVFDAAAWGDDTGTGDGPDDDAIDALVAARTRAREERDFARADALRDELQALGIVLEDGPDGTRWHRG